MPRISNIPRYTFLQPFHKVSGLCLLLAASACGGGDSANVADASTSDGRATDGSVIDASTIDGAADIDNDFGFAIRTPSSYEFDCGEPFGEVDLDDADWLCTFNYDGETGHVYVQSTPNGCETLLSYYPLFGSAGFGNFGESVEALSEPAYDWGGNHNNDFLSFNHGGKHFVYNHSSIGFGFRKCQPMDCLQVYESSGGALVEDGCTSERTLPVVCVQVEAGESYSDADFADTFAKCPGDDS